MKVKISPKKGGTEITQLEYPDVHVHLHSADDEFREKIHKLNQRLKSLETAVQHIDPEGINARFTELEAKMAETDDRVVALTAKVTEYNEDVTAKLNQLRSDVEALRAEVEAGRPAVDELARVNQSLFDLENAVGSGVTAVGDADGDGLPAAPVEG